MVKIFFFEKNHSYWTTEFLTECASKLGSYTTFSGLQYGICIRTPFTQYQTENAMISPIFGTSYVTQTPYDIQLVFLHSDIVLGVKLS